MPVKNNKTQKWKGSKLTKTQVTRLLHDSPYKDVTDSYKKQLPGNKFLLLNDRRFVMLSIEGSGAIYQSEQDFAELLNGVVDLPEVPYPNKDFLENIDFEIERLSRAARLQLTKKDKFDRLRLLDKFLQKKGWDNLDIQTYLIPITAYCGQVVINETNGVWIKQGKEYNIKAANGEIIDVSFRIRKDFINTPQIISFEGIFDEAIHHRFQKAFDGKGK